MADQQPEALRLADRLEGRYALHPEVQQAAAELRRLYAEIERLTAAWHCQHVRKVEERAEAKLWFEHAQKLHAVNAELLEALRLIAATDPVDAALDPQRAVRVARAAIAKAEGK
jgi:hypothetical protein